MYRTVIGVFLFSLVPTAASATDFMLGTLNNRLVCHITNIGNTGLTIFRINAPGRALQECTLIHNTNSAPAPCGDTGTPFRVMPQSGFGTTGATSFIASLSFNAVESLNGTKVECFGPEFSREPFNRIASWDIRVISTLDCDVCDDGSGITYFRYQRSGQNWQGCNLFHSQEANTSFPCGPGSPFMLTAQDGYGTGRYGYYVSSFHLSKAEDPDGMKVQCFGLVQSGSEISLVQHWNITRIMLDSSSALDTPDPGIIASSVCTVMNLLATTFREAGTTIPMPTPMSTLISTPMPTLRSTLAPTPTTTPAANSAIRNLYGINILFMLLMNLGMGT